MPSVLTNGNKRQRQPITPGQQILTPLIDDLLQSFQTTANQNILREDLIAIFEMHRFDPIVSLCIQVRNLYILEVIGEYKHSRTRVQKYIRDNIENSRGSWRSQLKMMSSYLDLGYSFTEVAIDVQGNKANLKELQTVDPRFYLFEGEDGNLTRVKYQGQLGDIYIPYESGLHLVANQELSFNRVTGSGASFAALPYWKLHKVLMPILSIAGQRQATPILVQKTETGANLAVINEDGTPQLDNEGNPLVLNKGYSVVQKLAALSNSGVAVIDHDDELYQVEPKLAGEFLLKLVELAKQLRMQAYLLPPTPFGYSQSGTGDSGLADVQLANFKLLTASWASDLMASITEGIVRPLIEFTYGALDDWGEFPIMRDNPKEDIMRESLAKVLQVGVFDDLDAINMLREYFDLPVLKELPVVPSPAPPVVPVVTDMGAIA